MNHNSSNHLFQTVNINSDWIGCGRRCSEILLLNFCLKIVFQKYLFILKIFQFFKLTLSRFMLITDDDLVASICFGAQLNCFRFSLFSSPSVETLRHLLKISNIILKLIFYFSKIKKHLQQTNSLLVYFFAANIDCRCCGIE